MWTARTDDLANRVEFVFHDLPIEARWSQWKRGAVLGVLVIPTVSWMIWLSLSWAGFGALWVIASALLGTVTGIAGIAVTLNRLGKFDTPTTPAKFHLSVLGAELTAPRAAKVEPDRHVTGPSFAYHAPLTSVAVPNDLTRSPYVCDCDPHPPVPPG